ncbi:MAG: RlmE family RNA methyltransferase [Rhodobacteraceae bacterium]|nr:MAG: RlmE family RNA methyltransferase [Paracoccaceae bacterium]
MKEREKNSSGRGQRELFVKVKSAKGRRASSTRWLQRQLNDPYVQRAKREGYRGRAAFKLIEINEKYNFLLPGRNIIDLGSAPGGWLQVAVDKVNSTGKIKNAKIGRIIGFDLKEIEPILGAEAYILDFLDGDSPKKIVAIAGGSVDVVMSDMAASSTGHKQTDHLRVIAMCEAAAYLAFDVLEIGGTFVAKVLAGGAEGNLQVLLKQAFEKVSHFKPKSSRADSSEKFVIATGFRGF